MKKDTAADADYLTKDDPDGSRSPSAEGSPNSAFAIGIQILSRLDRIATTIEHFLGINQPVGADPTETVRLVRYHSVVEVAKALKVKPEKVQHWIRTGELAAFNVASKPSGQPQWRITAQALAAFQTKRAAKRTEAPIVTPARRLRRARPPMKEILP